MSLSKAEEQLMRYLWKQERAYMKDLREAYPDPPPASTTVATLLKRLIDKGVVGYRQHGSVREYYPKVRKSEYFARHLNGIIKNFFDNSAAQFASFFTSETDLSRDELEALKEIVEEQLRKK